jgi:hypothetical protein
MLPEQQDQEPEIQLGTIHVILESVDEEARDGLQGALDICLNILDILRKVDFRSFESLGPQEAVSAMEFGCTMEVLGALDETIRFLPELPARLSGETERMVQASVASEENNRHYDISHDSNLRAIDGVVDPKRDRFCEDLDRFVLRMVDPSQDPLVDEDYEPISMDEFCRNLSLELEACRERLVQMRFERSKWGMITEGEEGRRKCQKVLRAAFTVGCCELAPITGDELFPRDPSELQTALFVRDALMAFRRDIQALVGEAEEVPSDELPATVDGVRARIDMLLKNDAYYMIRALDRFGLQDLRARFVSWQESQQDDVWNGRWTLQAVRDFTDILGNVNRRELLIEHDRKIRNRALGMSSSLLSYPPTEPEQVLSQFKAVLHDLNEMHWRDPKLDRFVATELEVGSSLVKDFKGHLKKLTAILQEVEL